MAPPFLTGLVVEAAHASRFWRLDAGDLRLEDSAEQRGGLGPLPISNLQLRASYYSLKLDLRDY